MKLLKSLSCLQLCDPMSCSPPGSSVHGSRQEYQSGWPFPSSDLPDPGVESKSPPLHADSLPSEPPGKPPDGKASACNVGDPGSIPWVGKIPWRRKWQPTPVLMPGKSHGLRSLVGYSPWGCKESDMTERLHFTSLHPHFPGEGTEALRQ